MPNLSAHVPDDWPLMEAFKGRIKTGGYNNVSTYLRSLIERDLEGREQGDANEISAYGETCFVDGFWAGQERHKGIIILVPGGRGYLVSNGSSQEDLKEAMRNAMAGKAQMPKGWELIGIDSWEAYKKKIRDLGEMTDALVVVQFEVQSFRRPIKS